MSWSHIGSFLAALGATAVRNLCPTEMATSVGMEHRAAGHAKL